MVKQRMLANSVIQTDQFLRMPHSAMVLYFFLNMTADNEGFHSAPESVMKSTRTSIDDLKILSDKEYVIIFSGGILVIRHWYINNKGRDDILVSDNHLQEKNLVGFDENALYVLKGNDEQSLQDYLCYNGGKSFTKKRILNIQKTFNGNIDNSHVPATYPPRDIAEQSKAKHIITEREGESSINKESVSLSNNLLYGPLKNVVLSDEELRMINDEFANAAGLIERVGYYLANSTKRYKSHFALIMKIGKEDGDKLSLKKLEAIKKEQEAKRQKLYEEQDVEGEQKKLREEYDQRRKKEASEDKESDQPVRLEENEAYKELMEKVKMNKLSLK
ncbi:MAG: hypothetical protein ACRCUS_08305 [Anaerovoracaceae bacterium]